MDEIDKIKSKILLKRLNSKEELQDWIYNYLDIKFPMGVVYPDSTHAPIDAMWRIYELYLTGDSKFVPQVTMLASRDSYKTLAASAMIVLLMVHFRLQLATAGAIKAQSDKMIQYIGGHFRKIDKYLVENGWEKISESKSRTDWLDENGWLCFARVVVATVAGMNCVKGNTKIYTDKGNLKASDIYKRIQKGELFEFISYNHKTNKQENKKVVATQKNKHHTILKIKTSKGTIECSLDHKVYVKGKGYVKAKDLMVGDRGIKKNPNTDYLKHVHGTRKTIKYIVEKTKSYKNITVISEKYTTNNVLMDFNCSLHGGFTRKWQQMSTRINKGLNPCQQCNTHGQIQNMKLTREDIVKYVSNTDFKLLDIETYKKCINTNIKLKCSKGHVFNITVNNFKNTKRCTKCFCVSSSGQTDIYNYVKSLYKGEVLLNDRKAIKPLEIDVYMPELKFGIEFDGLYWHSETVKKDIKKSIIKKTKNIKDSNINILMVFEDEWINPVKRELIKGMIRSRLGIFNNKLRASKLKIKKLNKNNEYKDFFETYHLDGHVNSSFAYGLFENGKMVSCMSFRKSFSDKCWEIARFASDFNYKIHGNAGKMVKAFKEEYNEKLITYSNNRLSLGKTYKTLGFKEITKTTSPSYYYTDFKTRLWRFKCKRINEPAIIAQYPTEKAQAEGGVFSERFLGHNKPLHKIYDYGHRKWVINE